eukprot:scaffold1638_cov120-Cylindrotheca_fusiformis.AAC.3
MNSIREIEKINQEELDRGIAGTPASWHSQYEKSPWVYVGNLEHQLTEGDVLCVMSQFGEIEDINLSREEDTGKSRGFAFVKYEDARSCILAVDNLVGVKLCGRSLRVDHMEKYRLPKKLLEQEEAKDKRNFGAGHAYADAELANQYSIQQGQDLFAPVPQEEEKDAEKRHKRKEEKRRKHQEMEERRRQREKHRARKEEKRRQRRATQYAGGDEESAGPTSKGDGRKREKDSKHKKRRRRQRGESSDTEAEESNSRESGRDGRKRRHKRSRRDVKDDSKLD